MQQKILEMRYLYEGETSFEDIAKRIASLEDSFEDREILYHILIEKKFLPAGRTIACAGTKYPIVPNCVTLPIEDSLESIMDTLKRAANLQKVGCGIGFNFSNLRPALFDTIRIKGKSSGPLSYLNLYSHTFKIVQQNNRSGANIAILSIEHPDILSFIHAKDDVKQLNNFNISVLLTKRFMDEIKTDNLWKCRWNGQEYNPRRIMYDEKMLVLSVQETEITAKELLKELARCTHLTGEPGYLFEDNMNINNPLIELFGEMNVSNPCGEITMYQNECCNLGSICLGKFVTSKDKVFDYDELYRVSRIATRFLNNNIDRLDVPDEELITFVKLLRRLGLGFMGLADCFAKLHIPYGSEESLEVLDKILQTMRQASYDESNSLIEKFGSVYSRLVDAGYDVSKISEENRIILKSRANIATMCIAPTGSTSLIHGMSSGIEPYFSLEYYQLGRIVYNKYLLKKYPINVLPIASELSPSTHLAIQAEAQKYVDNSISKTINCNHDVPIAEVINCIIIAHNKGIKGTTIYRDNCRSDQPLKNCNSVEGTCDL
jgi:ribonucleoside-diphosphate reductase alpha chain